MSYFILRPRRHLVYQDLTRVETGWAELMSFFYLLLLSMINEVWTHGRFIEPPARTSAWRFGFKTPRDYNDHETNCGGFSRQWTKNSGRCGQCGDAWDQPQPRPGETGGKYGRGVIVRSYRPGQTVKVTVDVTANHRGYFQFRLCPQPNPSGVLLSSEESRTTSPLSGLLRREDMK